MMAGVEVKGGNMMVGMKATEDSQTVAGIMITTGMTRVLAIALVFANAGRLDGTTMTDLRET
jgi:hypothetical protein